MSRIVVCLVFAVSIVLPAGCTRAKTTSPTINRKNEQQAEEALANLRSSLERHPDLGKCRNAVRQANVYMSQSEKDRPTAMTEEQQTELKRLLGLDDAECDEIEGIKFTSLDGYYVFTCFLLRDAVSSFDTDKAPLLDRVAAAFGWVCRQVRLQPRSDDPLPPHMVLWRGYGTHQERAIVFMSLLQQMGVPVCMVGYTEKGSMGLPITHQWIPGALIDKELYLFDTRMGMPLPGPDGKGIATLTQVRTDPGVLDQLKADQLTYDLTPDKAAITEVLVTAPLSGLSPRMEYLGRLIGPHAKVRLHTNLQESVALFKSAMDERGIPVRTLAGPPNQMTPTRVFRNNLTPEDGGVDTNNRLEAAKQALIPPKMYPADFVYHVEDPKKSPLREDLKARLRKTYEELFLSFYTEPLKERDLILRGQYLEATPMLRTARDELDLMAKVDANKIQERRIELVNWIREMEPALARLARAESEKSTEADDLRREIDGPLRPEQGTPIAKKGESAVRFLLMMSVERPYGAEVRHQFAICKVEAAERARLRQGNSSDTQASWDTALLALYSFTDAYSASPMAPNVRRMIARALAEMGKPDEAAKVLTDFSGDLTNLEKLGRLYQAARWQAADKP